jgi:hypothetical protein
MILFYDKKIDKYRACGETGVPVEIDGVVEKDGVFYSDATDFKKVYSDDGKKVVETRANQ